MIIFVPHPNKIVQRDYKNCHLIIICKLLNLQIIIYGQRFRNSTEPFFKPKNKLFKKLDLTKLTFVNLLNMLVHQNPQDASQRKSKLLNIFSTSRCKFHVILYLFIHHFHPIDTPWKNRYSKYIISLRSTTLVLFASKGCIIIIDEQRVHYLIPYD